MNFLERLTHIHRWKKTYIYTSLRDVFANPIGVIDCSGTITVGEECKGCGDTRSKITVYGKDGSIEKEYIR